MGCANGRRPGRVRDAGFALTRPGSGNATTGPVRLMKINPSPFTPRSHRNPGQAARHQPLIRAFSCGGRETDEHTGSPDRFVSERSRSTSHSERLVARRPGWLDCDLGSVTISHTSCNKTEPKVRGLASGSTWFDRRHSCGFGPCESGSNCPAAKIRRRSAGSDTSRRPAIIPSPTRHDGTRWDRGSGKTTAVRISPEVLKGA